MAEYKKQLEKGVIQRAYKGLMEYLMSLRTHIQRKHPDYAVPGSIYYGYMDMSYFSILPESLKERNLKIAIVFLHEAGRFEAWLSGYNKQVQAEYWKLIRESGWDKYHLVSTTKGADSILETVLVDQPDFSDLEGLTKKIESRSIKFIRDVEEFIARH
jgi:hypothetical protein